VVELGTPGDIGLAAKTFERLPVAYRGPDLVLYRVGGDTAGASARRREAVVIAHLAWLAMLVGAALGMAVATAPCPRLRRPTRRQSGLRPTSRRGRRRSR
jgi:hypothetical protein